MKVILLTEKGKKALGINDGESNRHGGPEHRYWVQVVNDHLQARGYKVAKEVPTGGGKTIDIVATRAGKQIAFEIETGKSEAAANIRKCREAGFEQIVVVATSAHVQDNLQRILPRLKTITVKLVTVSELLQRNWRKH